MSKFSLSAKLSSRANADHTHAVHVVYLFNRTTTQYSTGVAVDKELWDSVKKLCVVRSPADVEANNTIQQIQALLHSIASGLPVPTHQLVKNAFERQKGCLEDATWFAKQDKVVQQIEETESFYDVFGTIQNTSTMLEYERTSFRELMQEGAAMELKHQQAKTTQTKSKIVRRLEKAGIYKTQEVVQEEHAKDYKFFMEMKDAYLKELSDTDSVKKSTLKSKKSLFSNLARFKAATHFPLTFANIGFDFYKAYGDWLLIDEDNHDAYFGSMIKRLRTFLSWCVDERNIKVNPQFRSNKFKALKEEFDVVYLKTEELEWLDKFRNHSTCKPTWERVIDMALVQASIGCRYSDMVNSSWYFEGELLKGYTIKNDSTYRIPVKSSKWIQILKKYNMTFVLPVRHSDRVKVLSSVKFNAYLKLVLQAMYHSRGLHMKEEEKLVKKQTKRGVAEHTRWFKYELITSHSLRRTFVSRMVRAGYTVEEVGFMIGTKSLAELQKYFKLEEEDIANKADEIEAAQRQAKINRALIDA